MFIMSRKPDFGVVRVPHICVFIYFTFFHSSSCLGRPMSPSTPDYFYGSLAFLYKHIHVVLSFYKNNLLIKNKLHQLLVWLKTIFSHPMHDLPLFEVAIRPYVHSLIVVPPFVYKKNERAKNNTPYNYSFFCES